MNLKANGSDSPSCPLGPQNGRIIVDISADRPVDTSWIDSWLGIPEATQGPYPASIPDGVYDVTLASWDDHSSGPVQVQPNESWYLIIEDSSGDLILNTNPISDLPDDEDYLIEKVNSNLVLTEEAGYVTAFHAAYQTPFIANSVYPLCVAFDRNYSLNTSINSGSGTITGSGINCPGDCEEIYPTETWVTIIATPEEDYAFSSWSSGPGFACEGQTSICSVLMDGNKTARANFDLAPPFDYSLSNSGTSEVAKTDGDAYTQNTITKTLVAGETEPVILSLSGVPAGASYSIADPSSCSPTCTSVITFTVTPATPAGTYPITVTGSPLNKETNFDLIVSGNPAIVSCSVTPAIALLGETVTWTANVSGGTPPFTYSWSGTNIPTSPAPATNPLYINYTTVGDKTATVTVTDTDSVQADCPTVTVKVKIDAIYKEF